MEVKGKICCVCGKEATTYITTVFNSIVFYVCDEHKHLLSIMGGGKIGLIDSDGDWVKLKYYNNEG